MANTSKKGITTDGFVESDDFFADDDLITDELNEIQGIEQSQNKMENEKSFLERDNFEAELGFTSDDPFEEDFSDVSVPEIIEVFAHDSVGRPVIVLYAYRLPCNKSFDHLKFLRFLQRTLDKLVDQDYTIIYFHYGLRSNNKPPLKWLVKAYQLLDHRYKKNLKALYLVHPTKFIRFVWKIFQPFISLKFEKKVHYLNSLNELHSIINLAQLNIPQPILDHDSTIGQNAANTNSSVPSRPKSPPRPTQQFGVSLQFILDHNPNYDVPPIVVELIDFLRQNGLSTPGIFRKSAPVGIIETLESRVNKGEKIDFLNDPLFKDGDTERAVIHAAVLLKKFLRSLGEPIITNKLYSELAQLNGLTKENRLIAIREMISKLAAENYILLKMIIEFLIEVSHNSHENLMDANNLSIVFGPNLTWPTDQQVSIHQLNNLNSFCYALIKCYDQIFTRP